MNGYGGCDKLHESMAVCFQRVRVECRTVKHEIAWRFTASTTKRCSLPAVRHRVLRVISENFLSILILIESTMDMISVLGERGAVKALRQYRMERGDLVVSVNGSTRVATTEI